jgi:hypothetical protein
MHPMNYLFEDIYDRDWGIATRKRRGNNGPWKRDLHFLVERKRG